MIKQTLCLNDGAVRIFLNTRGTNDEETRPELVELLHYIENSTDETAGHCQSEKVKKLHQKVHEVKSSEEWGVRYMQAWEEKIYLKQEGREEGETRVSLLTRQLLKARRYEDLERAAEDPAYRRELYREFGL